jgi:hypothetical protein
MFNELSTDQITAQALSNNFSIREKNRRDEAKKNLDFYYDKGIEYVTAVNSDVEPVAVNLTRNITKKRVSLVYNRKLMRDIDGPSASVNFIERFYDSIDIDSFLLSVDLAAELTGTGLVHIRSDEDSEYGISLQLFNARDFSALSNVDNPNEVDAISLIRTIDKYNSKTNLAETLVQQQIWTRDAVVVYETASGKNPRMIGSQSHNLPIMPFVPFNGEDVDGQYIGHSPISGVRSLNSNINNILTDLAYTIKMNSFSPIAVEGLDTGAPINLNPGKALNLPMGAKATVLNFSPKIMDTLKTIEYLEEKTYETSSVPKVSIVGGQGNSGRELLIKWYPLIQVYHDKTIRYEKYEKNLMNTILKLVGLEPVDYLKVNFIEADVLPLSKEDDTIDTDIKMNIITPIDLLIRKDPDLTEEEAQSILMSNKIINDSIINSSDREDPETNISQEDTNE